MIFQEPMTSLNPVQRCGKQVMEALKLHQKILIKDAKAKNHRAFSPRKITRCCSYSKPLSSPDKRRTKTKSNDRHGYELRSFPVIADEPTTAFDVTVQKTILQLIKELQQEKKMGVIYITHDLGLVAEIADKVIVMYKGEIVETGYQ